jgi:PAS domain S-box-containing protein
MKTPEITTKATVPEFLSGGGELGQLIREYDWSATSLGGIETWPHSLRTCIRIMLTSRQPIWIGWGKELIKFYNDPYKTIVGGKHPWALGKPASVVWRDIWKDIDPLLRLVMENDEGTYVESQLLIMERNGYAEETYYTFSYTPIPGDHGGTAGMICANTDDTERIISERQLRTLTELGAGLTDSKTTAEIIKETIRTLSENQHDFPFAIFYSTAGNKGVFSLSTPPGAGANAVPGVIGLDENTEVAGLLREAAATRKLQVLENFQGLFGPMPKGAWEVASDKAIILPIGQAGSKEPYGYLVVGCNPYRLLDEKYAGFFSLVADQVATSFSSVHLLEEERKRAEALAEIDRAKTTFFSNISHEFRTPLTLLLGPIEDALQNPGATEDNRLRLDVAYRNALRMQRLVNTLLEFSRIEAGRAEGMFTQVDIGAFTEDLASTFRSAIEKAGMELIITKGDIPDEVYVDMDMWEKIILNLVSNAFKYSKKGAISLETRQTGQEVQVTVTDTGIGIPADQLDKIFSRFHRVENTEGRSQEGTGIGLAMVKELVKLHNGTILVKSELGKGSAFTVRIPVGKEHIPPGKIVHAPAKGTGSVHSAVFIQEAMKWLPVETPSPDQEKAAMNGSDEKPPSKGNKPAILLAEDNADMRDYLDRLLSVQYAVVTAVDGEDAYQKMLLHKPELVISDIMMPRLDGFGLLKKVRGNLDLRNTPVIFLSARAGEEAKVEGLDAGADDYLVKPFSARELIVRIANHIRINQIRRETEQQFYQLFLQAPVSIAVLMGRELFVEVANDKYLELIDRKRGEFVGRPLWEGIPEVKDQGFNELLQRVMDTGEMYTGNEQEVILIRDGRPESVFMNFIYSPLKDVHNLPIGVMVLAIDVSPQVIARRKIEESEQALNQQASMLEKEVRKRTRELSQLNISLQKSNDDLLQFAHVASHDLKEPVRKVKTFGNRLQDEYGAVIPDKGQEFLRKIQLSTDRIISMIDGVLNYSTLNSAEQTIDRIDLDEIFDQIEADLEVLIQEKNATFSRGSLCTIDGASVLIYQLFYNLINNALKFSKEEDKLVITITSEIVREGGKDMAKLVIADNGIGFSEEHRERIFNTFTRLNSKDKYEGTGLGLALCKKIVERHHGHIGATGEKGKGASFTILLPIRQNVQSL